MYRTKTKWIQEGRSIKPSESADLSVKVAIPALNDVLMMLAEIKTLITTTKVAEQYLDDVALCEMLHVSKKTTWKYRTKGLQYVQVEKKIYYKLVWVDDFLEKYLRRAF